MSGSSKAWHRSRFLQALAGALPVAAVGLAAGALASCGGSAALTHPLRPSQILSVDAASRTVTLRLVSAATNTYSGFNFDGYSAGELTVRVPAGWTVQVTCHNASTVLTHSCSVIDDVAIAPSGGPLAFPGSSSAAPLSGLACGKTSNFSFTAGRPGRYRIACLVSGHESDGMWDWLVVTAGGVPSVSV